MKIHCWWLILSDESCFLMKFWDICVSCPPFASFESSHFLEVISPNLLPENVRNTTNWYYKRRPALARKDFSAELYCYLILSCITSEVIGFITEGRVRIIIFARHTTQIFHITLVDVSKRHPRCELAFGDKEVIVKFLMKAYHGFRQMTIDSKIWEAF
jgi:hypothetical protein